MTDKEKPIIIVKKIKKVHGGHHGGSWKIAYADFVTAMMAFFLLLWLLSSLNKYQLEGIADYFNKPMSDYFIQNKSTGEKTKAATAGTTANAPQDMKEPQNAGDQKTQQTKTNTVAVPLKPQTASGAQTINKLVILQDKEDLLKLKKQLEKQIAQDPQLYKHKDQIKVDLLKNGLRIEIVDLDNRPMFALGSTTLEPNALLILSKLAPQLQKVSNRLLISGHTDAANYGGNEAGYSNWELSAERANSTRRALIANGLSEKKILRIAGLADTVPENKANPLDPSNRRISIILLNKQSEENFQKSDDF
jgi:chemotaxis protein MotB